MMRLNQPPTLGIVTAMAVVFSLFGGGD